MAGDDLNVLSALLAVAEERSFTRAARRLGVSQSALSHSIRGLEEQLGVRLLARTTRSVAPTDAGAELLARLGPALADIRAALGRSRRAISFATAASTSGTGRRDSIDGSSTRASSRSTSPWTDR